jgi:signal transduction histidine kinase
MHRAGDARGGPGVYGRLVRPPLAASVRALARHDGAIALAIGALGAVGGIVQRGSWWEVLGAAAVAAPLVWRRRWPPGVLAAVAGATVAYLALIEPSPAVLPAVFVALYTVAAHGSRGRTLAVAALVPPVALLVTWGFPHDEGTYVGQVAELTSQLGIALAIGEVVRSRRALLAALRERAERAERDRELEARRRVDEERVRIARDVHDLVAHSIATISTQAAVGAHVGRDEPARAVEVLESIKEVSGQALHDLRHALGVLREPADGGGPTAPTPALRDVPELVQRARDAGVAVTLRMEGPAGSLPGPVQLASYRIIQEGLTNVMRHAGGARATVRIAVGDDQLRLEVSDDGSGVPTTLSGAGSGSGLVGMRERAAAMGGALEARRDADGGFRVQAVLPLEGEAS